MEINQLSKKCKEEKARYENLQQALEQARYESSQAKNKLKQIKENGFGTKDPTSLYAEFQLFKGQVMKDITEQAPISALE